MTGNKDNTNLSEAAYLGDMLLRWQMEDWEKKKAAQKAAQKAQQEREAAEEKKDNPAGSSFAEKVISDRQRAEQDGKGL